MRTWVRGILALLGLLQVGVGAWALLAPRSFYDDGPFPGLGWVALFPPYNEHLMRDFGALSLALAVVIGAAVVTTDRRLVRVSMVAYLVFTLPHTIFHTLHLEHYSTGAAVAQTTALVATVIVPVVLLVVPWRDGGKT